MIESLLDPLRFEFFRNGLIAATLVGGLCGVMGVFIVLRHMAYIGHGLSHAVFGGAVVSFVMQFNFYVGASLWGFLAVMLINLTTRRRPAIGADAAIGIITTASFAVGVVLISRVRGFTRNFEAALFGNVLGVRPEDLLAIAIVSVAVGAVLFFAYRQLLFATFDPDVAKFFGVSTGWLDAVFALALASTVVVSMQILGVTMIAAAIVVPPIIARLLTDSFHRMVLIALVVGAFSGLGGIYLSWFLNAASGATVVLFATLLFVLALGYSSIRRRRPTPVEAHGGSPFD